MWAPYLCFLGLGVPLLTLAAQSQRTSTVSYPDRADFAVDLSAVATEPRVAQLDDPPACRPNLVMYWGQNSWGGQHLDDPANWEKDIDYYCQDDTVDVIIA
ncbi:Chitinase 2, partial [Tieghemiomyces parasiticus]